MKSCFLLRRLVQHKKTVIDMAVRTLNDAWIDIFADSVQKKFKAAKMYYLFSTYEMMKYITNNSER